jgi:hypothetical protein
MTIGTCRRVDATTVGVDSTDRSKGEKMSLIDYLVQFLALWIIVGECGTMRWHPRSGGSTPDPDYSRPRPPRPWWVVWVVGAIAGPIGGWLFALAWPPVAAIDGIYAAATCVGAFAVSAVVSQILGVAMATPIPEPPNRPVGTAR